MSNPNLLTNTSTKYKIAVVPITSTSATSILNNAASSGKTLKVIQIFVSSLGTTSRTANLNYYTQDDLGGTEISLSSISISTGLFTTFCGSLSTTNSNVILLEDSSLGVRITTANLDNIFVMYEEIS